MTDQQSAEEIAAGILRTIPYDPCGKTLAECVELIAAKIRPLVEENEKWARLSKDWNRWMDDLKERLRRAEKHVSHLSDLIRDAHNAAYGHGDQEVALPSRVRAMSQEIATLKERLRRAEEEIAADFIALATTRKLNEKLRRAEEIIDSIQWVKGMDLPGDSLTSGWTLDVKALEKYRKK